MNLDKFEKSLLSCFVWLVGTGLGIAGIVLLKQPSPPPEHWLGKILLISGFFVHALLAGVFLVVVMCDETRNIKFRDLE